jgi:hypothetical protein
MRAIPISTPPGARASARRSRAPLTEDSWVSRSPVCQSSAETSFTPATHCMSPLPSRTTMNWILPLERVWATHPRTSTAARRERTASAMRIQGWARRGLRARRTCRESEGSMRSVRGRARGLERARKQLRRGVHRADNRRDRGKLRTASITLSRDVTSTTNRKLRVLGAVAFRSRPWCGGLPGG